MGLEERPAGSKIGPTVDQESELAGGPITPAIKRADEPDILQAIDGLIGQMGGKAGSFDARLVRELMQTALKLIPDGRDTGELKLITSSVKELRYAYRVFGKFKDPHKVTIFGSARTPESHPDYAAAVEFSKLMAEAGWMSITGAGFCCGGWGGVGLPGGLGGASFWGGMSGRGVTRRSAWRSACRSRRRRTT